MLILAKVIINRKENRGEFGPYLFSLVLQAFEGGFQQKTSLFLYTIQYFMMI